MSVLEWLEYHSDKGTSLVDTIKDDLGAVVNRQVKPFAKKFDPNSVTHVRRTKDVVEEFHHIFTRAIQTLTDLDKTMMDEFSVACPPGSLRIQEILCTREVEKAIDAFAQHEGTPKKDKKITPRKKKHNSNVGNGTDEVSTSTLPNKADTTTTSSDEEPSSTFNNDDEDHVELDQPGDTTVLVSGDFEDVVGSGSLNDDLVSVDQDPLALDLENGHEDNDEEEVDLSQSLLIDVGTAESVDFDETPSPTDTVLLRRSSGSGLKSNGVDSNLEPPDDNADKISEESDLSRPPSRSGTVFIPTSSSLKHRKRSDKSLDSPLSPTGTVLVRRSGKKVSSETVSDIEDRSCKPKIGGDNVQEEDEDIEEMDVDFVPPTPDSEFPMANEVSFDVSDKKVISDASKEGKKDLSPKDDDATEPEDVFASWSPEDDKKLNLKQSQKSKKTPQKESNAALESDVKKKSKTLSREEAAARRGALASSSDDEETDKEVKSKSRRGVKKTEKKGSTCDQDSDPKLHQLKPAVELNPLCTTILKALNEGKSLSLPKNQPGQSCDEDSDGSMALLDKEINNLMKFNPLKDKEVKQSQSPKKKSRNSKKLKKTGIDREELSSGGDESCNEIKIRPGVGASRKVVDCSDLEDLSDEEGANDKNHDSIILSDDDSNSDSKSRKVLEDSKKKQATKSYHKAVVELSDDSDDDERRRALRDDSDSDDLNRKKSKQRKTNSGDSSSDGDVPSRRTVSKRKGNSKTKKKLLSDSEASNDSASESDLPSVNDESEESDFKSKKKSTMKSKRKKATSSDDEPQKKKKRKRIKVEKDTDDESSASKAEADDDSDIQEIEHVPASMKRKNIKKIMSDKRLLKTTKEAEREEEERKQRVLEKQKLFNGMLEEQVKDASLSRLVLDYDAKTKQPVIEVDKTIVKHLKPHQAEGVKFMYTACFESVEMIKQRKGGGCILAHCMGLGKTLQTVAFAHTMLSYKEMTGVNTVLIVCPLNTVTNWLKEFKHWLDDVETKHQPRIFALWDSKKDADRVDALKTWRRRGGVGIIHYDMFRNLVGKALGTAKGKGIRMTLKEAIKETLLDPGPDLVVCDEGHLLKNHKSKLTLALSQLKTIRRVVLTGTPLQNNLVEYHTMVHFVKPNLLGTLKEFNNRFVHPIKNGQNKDSNDRDVKIMKRRAHVLHCKLDGCVQRLDYSVLTPYLPPKHEYCIIIKLSEKQKQLYRKYLETKVSTETVERGRRILQHYSVLIKIIAHPIVLTMKKTTLETDDEEGSLKDFVVNTDEETSSSAGSDVEALNGGSKSSKRKTRSTKLDPNEESNSSASSANKEKLGNDWYSSVFQSKEEMYDINLSGKIVVLQEILKTCETIEDRVLVFSTYLTSLDIVEEFLAEWDEAAAKEDEANKKTVELFPATNKPSKRWRKGLEYFRIDGSVKTDDRQKHCDIFNKKSTGRAKLFLISTKAGGLGINLFGANRVVIFDASWNPSLDMQSIFRVYRFGQSKPCYIYRFVAQATIEEKIYNRQVVKLSLSSRVIDEHQVERHFKFDDINEMFKFEPDEKIERPTPPVPKDRLLADLLISHKDWIDSYFEHDSLLINKVEEELTEEERQQAWEEYRSENERRVNIPPLVPATPRLDPRMLGYVSNILRTTFPGAPDGEILQTTINVVQKFMEWTQLVQRKRMNNPGATSAVIVQLDKDIETLQRYCQQAVGKGMGQLVNIYNENTQRRQAEQEQQVQEQQQRLQQAIMARNAGRPPVPYTNMSSVVNQVFPGAGALGRSSNPSFGQPFSTINQPASNALNNGVVAGSSRVTPPEINLD